MVAPSMAFQLRLHDSEEAEVEAEQEESVSKLGSLHSCILVDVTNDSPVMGLSFPSAKLEHSRFSPLDISYRGEEALRSEGKILLQKSGKEDYRTPNLRAASHILSSPLSTTPLVFPSALPSEDLSTGTISEPETSSMSNQWLESSTDNASLCTQQTGSTFSLATSLRPTPIEDASDGDESFRGFLGNVSTRALHFDSPNFQGDIFSSVRSNSYDDLSDLSVVVNISPFGQLLEDLAGENGEENHAVINLDRRYSFGTEEVGKEEEEFHEDQGFGEVDDSERLFTGLRQNDSKGLTKSKGKHVRFSDRTAGKSERRSTETGRLKGTPVGKFLHFFDEEVDGSSSNPVL